MEKQLTEAVLAAIKNVIKTMLQQEATHTEPYVKKKPIAFGEVSSYIYLVDEHNKYSVAVSFPHDVIRLIARKMLPPNTVLTGEVIKDLTQEMANMFAGGAKSSLEDAGIKLQMSLPRLIAGKNHIIKHVSETGILMIPLMCDFGPFFVEICKAQQKQNEVKAAG